jgi:hypothetical protein
MTKSIATIRSEGIVFLLALFAVLLVLIAIFQPWWSLNTSPELQMFTNSTMNINAGLFRTLSVATTNATDGTTNATSFSITNTTAYNDPIFQTFNANRTDGSVTTTFTFSAGNLTIAQLAKQIANDTNLTLIMLVTGLVLAIVMTLLTVMVTMRNMPLERLAYLVGVLAAVFLLLAPLQMYNNVAGFSGSFALNMKHSIWNGETLATWGPSTGWFLTLAAGLVDIVCLLPIRRAYSERRRGLKRETTLEQTKVTTR